MPTKGSPVVRVRIDAGLIAEIEVEIARRNLNWRGPPWDFSGFLRAAIKEFRRKRKAGRAPKGQRIRRGSPATATSPSRSTSTRPSPATTLTTSTPEIP